MRKIERFSIEEADCTAVVVAANTLQKQTVTPYVQVGFVCRRECPSPLCMEAQQTLPLLFRGAPIAICYALSQWAKKRRSENSVSLFSVCRAHGDDVGCGA